MQGNTLYIMYSVKCVYTQYSPPCKARISDDFIKQEKRSLRQIMASPDVTEAEDPLQAFSEALLTFHLHYCKDLPFIQLVQVSPSGEQLDTKISDT